jgi:hypothetical protein
MTLENKCREHWKALGIMSTENLKNYIAALFNNYDHQENVLIELCKLVFPEWDKISRIKGYPEVGNDIWLFICRLFQKFDQKHHPNCMPGGAWMNTGFSVNHNLEGWDINFANCKVEYHNPSQSKKG